MQNENTEFDPSDLTWVIQDGTAHVYCADDDEARAVAELVQSVCGANVEREEEVVYCKFAHSLAEASEFIRSEPLDSYSSPTSDPLIAYVLETEEQACAELEELGFNVEIQA